MEVVVDKELVIRLAEGGKITIIDANGEKVLEIQTGAINLFYL